MSDYPGMLSRYTQLRYKASTKGGEYAGPCPLCGGQDRFIAHPNHPSGQEKWWCRQCGRGGDLIALRVELGEITPQEAGRMRNGSDSYSPPSNGSGRAHLAKRPVRSKAEEPSALWQEKAAAFVAKCQEWLWAGGNQGLSHLYGRGLTDATIRRWGLGWYGGQYGQWRRARDWGLDSDRRIYLPRGITIPWTVNGVVWYVKVRLFETWDQKETPKYMQIRGGEPVLYGLDYLEGRSAVVICEGELDAVLLDQEAGDLVDVAAIGSKTGKVDPKALAHLAGARRWLVALDRDAEDKAQEWTEYSDRVRRVRPLVGNDLTDMAQAGGDLRAWVRHHLGDLDTLPGRCHACGAPVYRYGVDGTAWCEEHAP